MQEMAAIVTYLFISTVISSALAYDPDMLQDLCVANTHEGMFHVALFRIGSPCF